jgi:hypothetical protein
MLKNFKAQFHRNGVFGEGFYCCEFDHEDGQRLMAVVFGDIVDEGQSPDSYAVITPDDIHERWRGDVFIGEIVQALLDIHRADEHALHRGQ